MSSHSDSELAPNVKVRRCDFKRKLRHPPRNRFFSFVEKTTQQHESTAKQEKLLMAVMTNNTELVQNLLEKGVNANATDDQSRSALHLATSRGYLAIVRLLLKHKADPNKQDTLKNTPLHLAACTSSRDLISELIQGGADVKQLNRHGRNALQLAQSKLRVLRRHWLSGAIELLQLKTQLEEIVDMIKLTQAQQSSADDLQFKNLNISSIGADDVDSKMTALLTELEVISIKD